LFLSEIASSGSSDILLAVTNIGMCSESDGIQEFTSYFKMDRPVYYGLEFQTYIMGTL
jgi:hypothetical protein